METVLETSETSIIANSAPAHASSDDSKAPKKSTTRSSMVKEPSTPTSKKTVVEVLKTSGVADAFARTNSDTLESAVDLPASQKLTDCHIESITLDDIRELFTHLSRSDNALVPFKVIRDLLAGLLECSDVEMDVLAHHIDVSAGGVVSAQQFYRAISTVSIQTMLRQIHRDMLRRRDSEEPDNVVHVERDFFVNRVNWRVDRDDAFATLPMTCLYMLIFMFLVIFHLQIWTRQEMERGIESWLSNQGKDYEGPFLLEHVYSVGTFNTWMRDSGLHGIFGDVRNHTDGAEIRMGNTNVLVGDVLLRQHQGTDYTERTEWLLHSEWGSASLATTGYELDFERAARESISYLFNSSSAWINDQTKDLEVVFVTYNNQAEMYALSQIRIPLDSYGYVKPIVKAKAVLTKGYPSMIVLVFDALYVLFILQVIYSECKDMCAAIRLGFKEFLDYWTFWNAVDWIAILFGFINIGLWLGCLMTMQHDSLQGLLDPEDKMIHGVMSFATGQLEKIHEDLGAISRITFALHLSIAATTLFIVLKFFKGFQANPRLQTVTMTLRCVATDVIHFIIVFVTIFASFAVIGHVLFGSDITKFYTLASSFNTGITVLMGEFDWYVELSESPDTLPSGMPRIFLIWWFVIYQFFVLLVMLNMLLAIILEQYTKVANHLSSRSDARTLWEQAFRFIRRQRQTKGFIPLYRIRRDLENDADPAHPAKVVTQESLQEAFTGMTDTQSKWIMSFLEQELVDKAKELHDNDATSRAKRTERFVQSIAEELHTIAGVITNCNSRIQRLEMSVRSGTGFGTQERAEEDSSLTENENTGFSSSAFSSKGFAEPPEASGERE